MGYYTIVSNSILTADKEETLSRFYKNVYELPEDYEVGKYIALDGELVLNPDWEKEREQKEKERIAKLSLTKREVFLALFRAKGLTPEMVRAQITDTEALIEFDYATEYFRFNPLIDKIGAMLGYTSSDLDYLFEHKEFPLSSLRDEVEAISENDSLSSLRDEAEAISENDSSSSLKDEAEAISENDSLSSLRDEVEAISENDSLSSLRDEVEAISENKESEEE